MVMKKLQKKLLPKIVCLFLGMAALAWLTACTGKLVTEEANPKQAWHTFFSYVSEGDFDAAFDMTGSRLKVSSSDFDGEWERLFLGRLAETCSYRFVSDTDAKGVRAWQQVDVTTLDMRKLVSRSVPVVLDRMEGQIWQHGSYKTDEALRQGLREVFVEQLSEDCSDCLTTQRVRVEFHYRDGQWQPLMNAALYDAVSGYAAYADEAAEASVKEYRAGRQTEEAAPEKNG